MRYAQALSFLDRLADYEKQPRPRDEFKLDNIRRFLGRAGNPQQRLPAVILVAGTKGKGSVSYMLEAALRACGRRTGLFVSPHVLDVRERIQLRGRPVSRAQFAAEVARLAPIVRRQTVSYFEFTAAMAFDLFARSRLDYCVVEVGLGGRLDATNLSEPRISVVTRIGLDHTKVLGGTLRRIAREKAGIMRRGRPVVWSAQAGPAERELRDQARRVGAVPVPAPGHVAAGNVRTPGLGISFHAAGAVGSGRVRLPLLGRHQVENCRTALAVLGLLARDDGRISFAAARRGLARVRIPARCQVVARRPLVIVDSCHNPESGRALARVMATYVRRRAVLVYGSLAGKLVARTVQPLAGHVRVAVLVRPDSPRAMALTDLKRVFSRLGIAHVAAASVPAALALARRLAAGPAPAPRGSAGRSRGPAPIVVAGSFYLAGEALAVLGARAPR